MKKYIFSPVATNFRSPLFERPNSFPAVKPGLSLSPRQMLEMTANGMSISQQNAANFDDGVDNPSWFVPGVEERGADVATLWERQRNVRSRIRVAFERDKRIYGDNSNS